MASLTDIIPYVNRGRMRLAYDLDLDYLIRSRSLRGDGALRQAERVAEGQVTTMKGS